MDEGFLLICLAGNYTFRYVLWEDMNVIVLPNSFWRNILLFGSPFDESSNPCFDFRCSCIFEALNEATGMDAIDSTEIELILFEWGKWK